MNELELGCRYCGARFAVDVMHVCTLSHMRPDLRAEVEALIASREREAARAALESLPVTKLSPLGMRHDEQYLIVFKREIDIAVEQLNQPEGSKDERPFPKYESHCHGAPVEIRDGKVKYWCTECGDPCIPVNKKG